MLKFIGTFTTALLLSLALNQAIAAERVIIATATDLSGPYAESAGKSSVDAIKMAIDDFGGKALGSPIEYLVADHQNKADITSKLVREWISEKKITALIDVISTPAALAAQRLANENKVISMFSGSAATDLINGGCSNISFLWNFDTYSMAAGFGAGISSSMPNRKWFLVTVDNKFGEQLEANLVEVLKGFGGQIIGSVKTPLGGLDYSAVILQAKASGADIVGLLISSADLINFVKQAQEYKLTAGSMRLAAPLLFTSDVNAMGQEAAKGLITGTSFYWNRTHETREWSLRYFKKYGRMPNEQNAGAYSMTSHYLKAVQAAGTVDSEKVAEKMRQLPLQDFFSANGSIRKDGRMVHDTFVARVRAPAAGNEAWDFFEILSTVTGDKAAFPLSRSTCSLVAKK